MSTNIQANTPHQATSNAAATSASASASKPIDAIPSVSCLQNASRIAIQQDKPIMLDYYVDTMTDKAFMGEDAETKEKMLVKGSDEFTSLIQKVYKSGDDFIILTENSLYIVSGKIQRRRIQAAKLRDAIEDLDA